MVSIWLVIVFVILSVISFFWLYAGNIYQNRTTQFEKKYITQARNAVDITLDQLDVSIRQIISDTNLVEYLEYPRGWYYEGLSGTIDPEDSENLFYYLESKERLKMSLINRKMSNRYFSSVYFYDTEKKFF